MPVTTLSENPHVSGEVYELGRAFTVPDERGKGYYSRVRKSAIAHACLNHPGVTLITSTDKEQVQSMNRKDKWTEISMADFLQIYGDEPQDRPGWTGFYKKL